MTTRLVDPTMLELSGVETGANVDQLDGAQGWIVLKAKEPAVPGAADTTTPTTPVVKDEGAAAPPAPTVETPTVETPTVDAPELVALRAELAAVKAELDAEKAKGKNPFADDEEEAAAEKALGAIGDAATREVIRKALIEARQDRETVEKMRDAEATRAASAHVAAHYSHLPVGDGFDAVVKALNALPEWAAVDRVLCAADVAVVKAAEAERAITGRRATSGLGEAAEQVETIAKGLIAAGTVQTIEQARSHVYRSNPELAARVRDES